MIMSTLRSFLFNVIFIGYTGVVLTLGALAIPFPRRAALWVAHSWARVTFWALRAVVGLDIKVVGLENVTYPCIVACKHQSAWETVVFHLIFSDACYVLKKELDRLSFGWFLKRLKMIVVDRKEGRRSLVSLLTQAKAVAASGRPIVIFPEGTRSAPGERGKYQKGVAALYKALDVPVYPVALNSGYFWGRRAFDKKKGTVEMVFLDPIAPGLEIDTFLDTLEEVVESACDRLPKG